MKKFYLPAAALAAAVLLTACGAPQVQETAEMSDAPRHVLVIDAGHGGEDGGAQSASGLSESDINLEIALRMEALARFCGVETRMTRRTKEIEYPPELTKTAQRKTYDQKQRVALVSETPDAVLVSIHQNKYPDPRPFGPQVLYGGGEDSRAFGELAHALLTQTICPENRRVAAPISKDIYLMRMVNCPAILAECGFLSNASETEKLAAPAYQTKIACTLLCAYMQYFSAAKGT